MVDLSDLRFHQTFHQPALNGREYILRVSTHKSGVVEFRHKLLFESLQQALGWRRKALWVELLDFRRETLVSRTRFARLWAAAAGDYGTPSRQHPYLVRGPTINPTFMERYWTIDLLKALDFSIYWQSSCWDDPYWVEVRGPNGNIVLSRRVIERLYHASVRAEGHHVVEMVVQGPTFEVVDGKLAMRPATILEQRVIA